MAYHLERSTMLLHDAVGVNWIKGAVLKINAQVPHIWTKGCICWITEPASGQGAIQQEYLLVQVSSISCRDVGSILALLGKTLTQQCLRLVDGGQTRTLPCTVNCTAKKGQKCKIKLFQIVSIYGLRDVWWMIVLCYLTCHDYPSLVEGESHGILLL